MRRVWFKEEMKDAILAGKKTATTRYHQIPLGKVQAVCGSRFKAERFATLKIISNDGTTWEDVLTYHYREEGFKSTLSMMYWGEAQGLLKGAGYEDDHVYFHRFIRVPEETAASKGTTFTINLKA